MKWNAPLLITLFLVVAIPFGVQADEGPCDQNEPGDACTIDMSCEEPPDPDGGPQEVECQYADGTVVTCTAYPQPGRDDYVWGCPGPPDRGASSADMAAVVGPYLGGGLAVVSVAGLALLGATVIRSRIPKEALLVPLAVLFSRVKRSEVLEQPKRRLIFDLVEQRPGIRLVEVGDTLGLTNGELRHHVRVLRENGMLVVTRRIGRVTLRVAGTPPTEPLDEPARELLGLLEDSGTHNLEDARRCLGWTRAKTRYWARKLVAAGMVQVRKQGRVNRLSTKRGTGASSES